MLTLYMEAWDVNYDTRQNNNFMTQLAYTSGGHENVSVVYTSLLEINNDIEILLEVDTLSEQRVSIPC